MHGESEAEKKLMKNKNGKKTYLEMKKFLIKEFMLNEDLFCWFDQDVERENSIKEVVYATFDSLGNERKDIGKEACR